MAVNKDTKAILQLVYPIIEKAMDKNYIQWKRNMGEFIQNRNQDLFDIAPCERIYYSDTDRQKLFSAIDVDPKQIKDGISHTYYSAIHPFKPQQAKDPTTIVCLCIIRYFLLKKNIKDLELSMIYLSFSGKFYPSIHYAFFRLVTPGKYRHIMEYVVNQKLTNKYELKASGTIIASIKNLNKSWIAGYNKEINEFDDEDVCYMIEQLHTRMKSFMKNIASAYYEAYKNKEYITYDKDSLPEEGDAATFHLSGNDSFRLQQYVEKTMERINTTQVDVAICKQASDANVKTEEVRGIMETIIHNKENIKKIKELITAMIGAFMQESTVKDVNSMAFFNYSMKQRSNIVNKLLLRNREIIEGFLEDNSVQYRKRKHRNPTRLSYFKALQFYFTMIIIKANSR